VNDVALNELSISFPDFKLNEVINPEEFDTNNSEIVNKINALIEVMNKITDSTTDGDSGADNVAVTLIDGYTATKLQPLLEEIVAKLTSTTSTAENAVESVAQKVDKSYVDEIAANFVLGIVPDGTITEEKLHPDVRESIETHLNETTIHTKIIAIEEGTTEPPVENGALLIIYEAGE